MKQRVASAAVFRSKGTNRSTAAMVLIVGVAGCPWSLRCVLRATILFLGVGKPSSKEMGNMSECEICRNNAVTKHVCDDCLPRTSEAVLEVARELRAMAETWRSLGQGGPGDFMDSLADRLEGGS